MKRIALTFVLAVATCYSVPLLAQQLTASAGNTPDGATLSEVRLENWSLYEDEENQLLYIDFEQLPVHLNDIVVKDANGSVVWREEVFDLPPNTIYELDTSRFNAGKYAIELRTLTSVIRREVSLGRS